MRSTLTTSPSRPKKKYVLIGGDVRTGDKTWDYVSPHSLMRLYGLHPSQCHFMSTDEDRIWMRGYTQEYLDSLIKLRPREDGRYRESLREMGLR